jgi:hypothetical protein
MMVMLEKRLHFWMEKKEKMSRKRWEIGRGRCRSALTRGA